MNANRWIAPCLALTFALVTPLVFAEDKPPVPPVPLTPHDAPAKPVAKPKKHALPKDPKTAVVTLDSAGGMLMRQNPEPAFQVLADGTVLVGDPYGVGRKSEGKISADELQTLLQFLLDEQKIADIKPSDLRMKGRAMVSDASTTTLTVEADGVKQEIAGRAVEMVARQAGADSPAARFVAITSRLNNLGNITRLGGHDGLEKHLAAANAALKAKYPDEGQVTAEDLRRGEALPKGSTRATFDHRVTVEGDQWHALRVTVEIPVTGEPRVKVEKGVNQPK